MIRLMLFRFFLILPLLLPGLATAGMPLDDYLDYQAHRAECDKLAESPNVSLEVIGVTAEGRDVVALTVGMGDTDDKPAILVMGSVQANSLVGDELARRMVALATKQLDAGDAETAKLLEEVTFYVIPRPSPDASERLFQRPLLASSTNTRPMDDDRDGRVDEDSPADINGDGLITQMRVEDPTGKWITHPDDPRLMIKADATKGEVGRYRLLTEDNADDDGDEQFAEDAAGGTDFNRNFTFNYPYFKSGAGPHQVSEPETRAVANFAFDHPNIFLVFSFAPQANLLNEWKSGGEGRIKTSVMKEDVPYLKLMKEKYGEAFETKGKPEAASLDGSFAAWAYYHYGRWSVATPGWWVPVVKEEKPEEKPAENTAKDVDAEKNKEEAESAKKKDDAKSKEDKAEDKKKPDDRAKADQHLLKWLEEQKIDGFIDWQEVDRVPEAFAGKKVEVGGFKPSVHHPPVDQLAELAEKHAKFLMELAAMRPQLSVATAKPTKQTGASWQHEVSIINRGVLPTASKMGEISGKLPRLEIAIDLPEQAKLLVGPRRKPLGAIAGGGSHAVATWLWLNTEGRTHELRLGYGYQRDDDGNLPLVENNKGAK